MPDRARWRNWLDLITPRSGRIRDEDGRYLNEAGYYASDNGYASREGRLYRAWWSGSVPGNTTYDITMTIPEGVQVYGLLRTTTVFDGTLIAQFGVAESYSSPIAGNPGRNPDELLEETSEVMLARATVAGFSRRDAGPPIVSPATGPIRTPSSQSIAGAHPRFDSSHLPVFRHINNTADAVQLWFDLIWEERAI